MLDRVIRYYTVKVDENVDPQRQAGRDRRRDLQQGRDARFPTRRSWPRALAQLPRFEEDDIPAISTTTFLPALDNDLPITKGKE